MSEKIAVKIRRATFKDMKVLPNIEIHTVKHDNWKYMDFVLRFITPGYCFLVAEKDNQVIGFITYYYIGHWSHGMLMGVMPEFQHHGIGTKLMVGMFKDLHKRKVKTVRLEVRGHNEHAIAMYYKLGWKLIKKNEHYYPDDDCLIMTRDLTTIK